MHILFIALASIILSFWILLLLGAPAECGVKIALQKLDIKNQEIATKKRKILEMRHKLANATSIERSLTGIVYSEKSEMKSIKGIMKNIEQLKAGKLELTDIILLAGYTLMDRIGLDNTTPFFKKMVEQNSALTGRNTALDKTRYQIAMSMSYIILGVGSVLCLAALLITIGMQKEGLITAGIGTIIVAVLAYLPLDDLETAVEKRQDELTREFPQAVSKLTLLVGAGIDMSQAWQQTADSKSGTIYREMMIVNEEIHNGISPYDAYNGFIHRCNNKYTSKLGTSIMQNLSKGNDEICTLLREITSESWNDRRQYAKRKGELAQSKLLLPIMMMFAGIILLVMAPVMGSFTGGGM